MTEKRIRVNAVEFSLGDLTLNGYKDPSNIEVNYLSGRQIAECIEVDESATRANKMAKELKAMLGNDFTVRAGILKMKSGGETKLNLWTTEQAFVFWTYQVTRWNQKALTLVLACGAESLDRRINKAFGIHLSEEEYNERMKARFQGKVVRRTLTDAIKDWLERTDASENTRKFLYSTITDNINRGIFSRSAKKLKQDWKCANPRDKMTADELRWVAEVEDLAMRLIDNHGFDPIASVKEALERLLINKVGR